MNTVDNAEEPHLRKNRVVAEYRIALEREASRRWYAGERDHGSGMSHAVTLGPAALKAVAGTLGHLARIRYIDLGGLVVPQVEHGQTDPPSAEEEIGLYLAFFAGSDLRRRPRIDPDAAAAATAVWAPVVDACEYVTYIHDGRIHLSDMIGPAYDPIRGGGLLSCSAWWSPGRWFHGEL